MYIYICICICIYMYVYIYIIIIKHSFPIMVIYKLTNCNIEVQLVKCHNMIKADIFRKQHCH